MIASAEQADRIPDMHGPAFLESHAERRREELGEELHRAESCYSLWMSVVELAVRDLAYVQEKREKQAQSEGKRSALSSHERSKLNRILEHDPAEFLRDAWFDHICDYLGVSAKLLRDHAGEEATPRKSPNSNGDDLTPAHSRSRSG